MTELDRIIHEPARLRIVALLSGANAVDFMWFAMVPSAWTSVGTSIRAPPGRRRHPEE